MQDQYLKLPRLNPDALSRCERLLRDWESMAGTDNSVDGCAEELRAALYQTGAATMADVELLPLPEWVKCDDLDGLTPEEVRAEMRHYARANVARAVEPLQAEIDALRTRLEDTVRDSTNKIEALRAEVESVTCELMDAITRADKLAEALRLAEEHIDCITPKWYNAGQRLLAAIRDALRDHGQEGGQ